VEEVLKQENTATSLKVTQLQRTLGELQAQLAQLSRYEGMFVTVFSIARYFFVAKSCPIPFIKTVTALEED
jgi:hypothetical protein